MNGDARAAIANLRQVAASLRTDCDAPEVAAYVDIFANLAVLANSMEKVEAPSPPAAASPPALPAASAVSFESGSGFDAAAMAAAPPKESRPRPPSTNLDPVRGPFYAIIDAAISAFACRGALTSAEFRTLLRPLSLTLADQEALTRSWQARISEAVGGAEAARIAEAITVVHALSRCPA